MIPESVQATYDQALAVGQKLFPWIQPGQSIFGNSQVELKSFFGPEVSFNGATSDARRYSSIFPGVEEQELETIALQIRATENTSNYTLIDPRSIVIDQNNIQFRVRLNKENLEKIQNMIDDHEPIRPILVALDSKDQKLYLVDGEHRLTQVLRNQEQAIRAKLIVAPLKLLKAACFLANNTNGKPIDSRDKHAYVESLLEEEFETLIEEVGKENAWIAMLTEACWKDSRRINFSRMEKALGPGFSRRNLQIIEGNWKSEKRKKCPPEILLKIQENNKDKEEQGANIARIEVDNAPLVETTKELPDEETSNEVEKDIIQCFLSEVSRLTAVEQKTLLSKASDAIKEKLRQLE